MDIKDIIPFHSDVWGTVSDWVMVIVTFFTALFLYKTFRSQLSVQKMQQRITDIEGERFRIEYKPTLTLDFQWIKNTVSNDNVESLVHMTLSVTEKDCKSLTIKGSSGVSTLNELTVNKKGIGLNFPIDYVYYPDSYNLYFRLTSSGTLFPIEGVYLWVVLEFSDVLGNSYSHELIYNFKDDRVNIQDNKLKRLLN